MDNDFMSPSEEYHTASANLRKLKQNRQVHALSYDSRIAELVQSAPLHLESTSPPVKLPADIDSASLALCHAITTRQSSRNFVCTQLSLSKLGTILHLANGVRTDAQADGGMSYHRNAPNAGNLGSVEIYCIAFNVEGVEPGIYHFDSVHHELRCLQCADYSPWLRTSVLLQEEFADGPVLLVLTSAVSRLAQKYGLRGYRLALMDVGHVSQNIYLVATALNLEVCATAGFIDCDLNRALELDGLERCAQLVVGISERDSSVAQLPQNDN